MIAHTMDPLHALGDSQACARELLNARLTRAKTFFEMRFSPGRLSAEIGDFVDGCWTEAPSDGRVVNPGARVGASS